MEHNTTVKDYEYSSIPLYTPEKVRRWLNVYTYLQVGKLPAGEEEGIQNSREIPSSEMAMMTKCDIDKALACLNYREVLLVFLYTIMDFDKRDCTYFCKMDYNSLDEFEDNIINKMARYLNTGK